MIKKLILIKYGELTTKKSNRSFFIKTLDQNIKNLLEEYKVIINKDRVRMYIETEENLLSIITEKLKKVFGIHSIVICYKVNNNMENIKRNVLQMIKEQTGSTFKVITKEQIKIFLFFLWF